MLKIGLSSHSDTHPTHIFISRKSPQNKPTSLGVQSFPSPTTTCLSFPFYSGSSISPPPFSVCVVGIGYSHLATLTLTLGSGSRSWRFLQDSCHLSVASFWLPESSLVLLQMLYLKPLKMTSLLPPLQSLWPWRRGTPSTLSLCPQMCSVGLWVEPAYQRGNTQASPPPLSQCFRGEEGGILTQQAILHLVCSSCLAL